MLLHDSVTERGIETLENAGGEQKGLHLLGLPLEDDFSQIVQNVALIPTDLLQEAERINLPVQRKTEQSQTHQPALRRGDQRVSPELYAIGEAGALGDTRGWHAPLAL